MKIYFIGIGGISMSALARFLHKKNYEVLGSEAIESEMVNLLRKEGIKIYIPQNKKNIDKSIGEVVYTSAITPGSPGEVELGEARRLGIKTTKRAQKIGELTRIYKTIAISGTHGKSTTTAMILQVLIEANKNPSALLGSNFDLISSNYRVGKSKYLIIESDEFDRSFHNFYVDFGAILNVEADHLDYFKKGLPEINEAFTKYIQENFKQNSYLVLNADDKNLGNIITEIERDDIEIKTFGKKGDYNPLKIKMNLAVPGEHNRMNALAALALAEKIGISRQKAIESLENFKGAGRRFEFRGEKDGVKVYDDYAHHPTEVKATLLAAREKFGKNRIISIFQPHQYSRTAFFADEFARSFKDSNIVIIPPIYEVIGRDEEKKTDNNKLALMIKKNNKEVYATASFDEAVELLNSIAKAGDIVMVMGAGPVTEISKKYLK